MSNNKGGRPSHHQGETKKAAIAVRTAPSLRDALKAAADEAGRSITQEVEARLQASFDTDGGARSPETERLLNRIGSEIAEIETMTGKRWHRDRKTAGAVLEFLAKKPQHWIRVDDPSEDEIVQAAWKKLTEAREHRDKLGSYLTELGIEVGPPRDVITNRGGLFGRGTKTKAGGLLATAIEAIEARWREKQQIESLDLPEQVKKAAEMILEQLITADEDEAEANLEWQKAVAPFYEAEQEGRAAYRNHRMQFAQQALQRGELPDMSDWMIG